MELNNVYHFLFCFSPYPLLMLSGIGYLWGHRAIGWVKLRTGIMPGSRLPAELWLIYSLGSFV